MTNLKQAEQFILTKLNECCLFTHEDYAEGIPSGYAQSIFHIWDKQALRTKKLLRLNGLNDYIEFKPGQNSIYLFKQDYNNGYFWYDYANIYLILKNKYGITYQDINKIIRSILNDENQMSTKWRAATDNIILNTKESLIPFTNTHYASLVLNDDKKTLLKQFKL